MITYRDLLVILAAAFILLLVAVWIFRISPRLARASNVQAALGPTPARLTPSPNSSAPVRKILTAPAAPTSPGTKQKGVDFFPPRRSTSQDEEVYSGPPLSDSFAENGARIATGGWYAVRRGFMTHEEIVRMFPNARNLEEKRKAYEQE